MKEKRTMDLSAEHYLDITCKNLSAVNRIICQYGDVSLSTYLQNFVQAPSAPYQKRDDFFEVVYKYAAPLLGNVIARRAARDLAKYPVVLTANHHGAYFFSQSIQSCLIFSLNTLSGRINTSTVPVFSCGNVPLNNSEFPRGLLLYQAKLGALKNIPIKLPVFPDRLKRRMVSVTPSFDEAMIRRAEARLDKMVHKKQIAHSLAGSLHEIFRQDYGADSVLSLPNYSQQLVVLNSRIWKRLLPGIESIPEMVCLEIEKIVVSLLISDISNPKSLAWTVMFDPALREHVLSELDGVRGCWKLDNLLQRLQKNITDKLHRKALDNCGTIFFWGIDSVGRRIPLYLETDSGNKAMLQGIDDRGNSWEMPYTSREITKRLLENRLLPSLFTCYLVLLARGVICIGGYFQCEYLPKIQQTLSAALQATGYYDVALLIESTPTDYYLQSMLAVMSKTEDGHLIPAGPLEIIAGGGITSDDIRKMLSLTVREAHLAALFETVIDGVPKKLLPSDWKNHLTADFSRVLKDKVVIK